jgi:zinc protease
MVGAINREQAEAIAKRLTDNMPVGEKAVPLPPVPALESGEILDIEFPSSQTHLLFGQPVMARLDKDYFPLYVGNHMLGGSGLVSMLGDEVREKRGLAYSVYSYFLPMRAKGPYLMGAQTRTDRSLVSQKVILETLDDFRAKGPSEERMTSSIKNITGGFPLRIASNSNIVEYIAMMGFYDYPLDYLDTFVDKVKAVTAEQVRDAFQRRIDPEKFVIVRVGKAVESSQEKQEASEDGKQTAK